MNEFLKHCNEYKIRKLSLEETIKSFNCGDTDLNQLMHIQMPFLFTKRISFSVSVMMMNLKT